MCIQLELSTKDHQEEALAVSHPFQECDRLCAVLSEFRSAAFPIQRETSKQFQMASITFRIPQDMHFMSSGFFVNDITKGKVFPEMEI